MRIGLHDAEYDSMPKKRFPNLALMKISAFHKSLGDTVYWYTPILPYHYVYSSKVFDFTPTNQYLPLYAHLGGTGYSGYSGLTLGDSLPDYIDDRYPDYSIYPKCDYAIGFLTRGCPNRCEWCVVPEKEGYIRAYRKWQDVVRQDTNKLVLLDNNILACEHGIEQLYELSKTGYKIDLNQGMDARLVDEKIADIIAKIKWLKDIRFSCDHVSQIEHIDRVAEMLKKRGISHTKLFIYILVRSDIEDAEYRVQMLKKYRLYAQAEHKRGGIMPSKLQKEFCRYVYGKCYKHHTWDSFKSKYLKGLNYEFNHRGTEICTEYTEGGVKYEH